MLAHFLLALRLASLDTDEEHSVESDVARLDLVMLRDWEATCEHFDLIADREVGDKLASEVESMAVDRHEELIEREFAKLVDHDLLVLDQGLLFILLDAHADADSELVIVGQGWLSLHIEACSYLSGLHVIL